MNDPVNPYAAPKVDIAAAPPGLEAEMSLQDASGGARFLTFVIDMVMIQLVGVACGIAIGISGAHLESLQYKFVGFGITLGYYIVLEAATGRTLGKLVTGTRVVRPDGTRPSFGQIVGRTFARLIPFEPFSLLGSPRGWHDSLSGTRVIRARD